MKVTDKQQATIARALKGATVTGFNFTNSDVIGLTFNTGTTVFVPNDDVLIAIGALE